jgi:hypothetical protein
MIRKKKEGSDEGDHARKKNSTLKGERQERVRCRQTKPELEWMNGLNGMSGKKMLQSHVCRDAMP